MISSRSCPCCQRSILGDWLLKFFLCGCCRRWVCKRCIRAGRGEGAWDWCSACWTVLRTAA